MALLGRRPTHTVDTSAATKAPQIGPAGSRILVVLRIAFGLTFLWAFVDKVFGLGYATPSGKGLIDGLLPVPRRRLLGHSAVHGQRYSWLQ